MSIAEALMGDRERAGAALYGAFAKRVLDLLVGVPLCAVAIPVVLVLAAVLAVQHAGHPFFVHDRIGRGGRTISIPKLRTLVRHTPRYADKTLEELESPSRLASFLRRSHLDELPQLFLVPFGRLSLVGPRPRMRPEADEHGDAEYEAIRTSVPQGCTGLWQISVGNVGRVSDHPEYDLFYVEQRTLALDLWILWRTLRQAVLGGSVRLDDIPRWMLRQPELVLADAS